MAEKPSSCRNLPYFEASTSVPLRTEASSGPHAGLSEVPLQHTSSTGFPCKFGSLLPSDSSAPYRCAGEAHSWAWKLLSAQTQHLKKQPCSHHPKLRPRPIDHLPGFSLPVFRATLAPPLPGARERGGARRLSTRAPATMSAQAAAESSESWLSSADSSARSLERCVSVIAPRAPF